MASTTTAPSSLPGPDPLGAAGGLHGWHLAIIAAALVVLTLSLLWGYRRPDDDPDDYDPWPDAPHRDVSRFRTAEEQRALWEQYRDAPRLSHHRPTTPDHLIPGHARDLEPRLAIAAAAVRLFLEGHDIPDGYRLANADEVAKSPHVVLLDDGDDYPVWVIPADLAVMGPQVTVNREAHARALEHLRWEASLPTSGPVVDHDPTGCPLCEV